MNSFLVGGELLEAPYGVTVRNYKDLGVCRFNGRDRSGIPVTEVVLHETVTRDVKTTVRVIERRKLGVHLIVGPDGQIGRASCRERV